MPTMADVAKAAGVSRATVSIVVNGKHAERKISEETVKRINETMHALRYKPNVSARRLKGAENNVPIIALYWPLDYRFHYLARFMSGIQTCIRDNGYQCELITRTFVNNELEKDAGAIVRGMYSGAIISSTSEKDMAYLESISPQIPTVLLNRTSEKYHTVSADNNMVTDIIVRFFKNKGHRHIAAVSSDRSSISSRDRTAMFIQALDGFGIRHDVISAAENSMEGGTQAAMQFASLDEKPTAVYCDSDYVAMGFIYACNKLGIRIPEDLEMISVGLLETVFTKYLTPALTVVSLPVEDMAANALALLMENIKSHSEAPPIHRTLRPNVIIRESFSPRPFSE